MWPCCFPYFLFYYSSSIHKKKFCVLKSVEQEAGIDSKPFLPFYPCSQIRATLLTGSSPVGPKQNRSQVKCTPYPISRNVLVIQMGQNQERTRRRNTIYAKDLFVSGYTLLAAVDLYIFREIPTFSQVSHQIIRAPYTYLHNKFSN